mmetsp:Transcript_62687/g.136138  ORF Transcript_62687/g.136138 Transcript_62687/m.136138 type:complete len:152 (-) Transcript_62687:163-618(-)
MALYYVRLLLAAVLGASLAASAPAPQSTNLLATQGASNAGQAGRRQRSLRSHRKTFSRSKLPLKKNRISAAEVAGSTHESDASTHKEKPMEVLPLRPFGDDRVYSPAELAEIESRDQGSTESSVAFNEDGTSFTVGLQSQLLQTGQKRLAH